MTLPKLPSGRIDKAVSGLGERIHGDGNVLSAFTHNRDVGRYVVRATLDPRTLNKFVFIYSEMLTMNQVYDQLEQLSGETLPRNHVSRCLLVAIRHTLGLTLRHYRHLEMSYSQIWLSLRMWASATTTSFKRQYTSTSTPGVSEATITFTMRSTLAICWVKTFTLT